MISRCGPQAGGQASAVVRKRALPPEKASMDYSVLPASKVDMDTVPEVDKQRLQEMRGGVRLLEKIGKIPMGGVRRSGGAGVKVSVEGRGLVLRDT